MVVHCCIRPMICLRWDQCPSNRPLSSIPGVCWPASKAWNALSAASRAVRTQCRFRTGQAVVHTPSASTPVGAKSSQTSVRSWSLRRCRTLRRRACERNMSGPFNRPAAGRWALTRLLIVGELIRNCRGSSQALAKAVGASVAAAAPHPPAVNHTACGCTECPTTSLTCNTASIPSPCPQSRCLRLARPALTSPVTAAAAHAACAPNHPSRRLRHPTLGPRHVRVVWR